MVLIDVQVAATAERQGEAGVFGELFEHVIEEPDTGSDLIAGQVLSSSTATLMSVSRVVRCTARPALVSSDVRNAWPIGCCDAANAHTADAEIARKFQVAVTIADHRAALGIERLLS